MKLYIIKYLFFLLIFLSFNYCNDKKKGISHPPGLKTAVAPQWLREYKLIIPYSLLYKDKNDYVIKSTEEIKKIADYYQKTLKKQNFKAITNLFLSTHDYFNFALCFKSYFQFHLVRISVISSD